MEHFPATSVNTAAAMMITRMRTPLEIISYLLSLSEIHKNLVYSVP